MIVQLSAAIGVLGIWILLLPVTNKDFNRMRWLHVLLGAVIAGLATWAALWPLK